MPRGKKRTTRNTMRRMQERDNDNDSDVIIENVNNHNRNNDAGAATYTQLLYQLQRISDFKRPFIARTGLDTLRWILDINDYVAANADAPENLLFDKIMHSIPKHVQRYYRNYLIEQNRQLVANQNEKNEDDGDIDLLHYKSLITLKQWAKYQYPPTPNVDSLINKLNEIQFRYKENPLTVFDRFQILCGNITLCTDLLNEDLTEDQQIPHLSDRDKWTQLKRIFITQNNVFSHNNVSKINDKIKKYIGNHNPITLQQFVDLILALPDIVVPRVHADDRNYQFKIYKDEASDTSLFQAQSRPYNTFSDRGSGGRGGRGSYRGRGRGRGDLRGGFRGRGRGNFRGRGRGLRGGGYRQHGRDGYGGGRGGGNGSNQRQKRTYNEMEQDAAKSNIECFRCGKYGHYSRECRSKRHKSGQPLGWNEQRPANPPNPPQNTQKTNNNINRSNIPNITCYRCGFDGHVRRDCMATINKLGQPIDDYRTDAVKQQLSLQRTLKGSNNNNQQQNNQQQHREYNDAVDGYSEYESGYDEAVDGGYDDSEYNKTVEGEYYDYDKDNDEYYNGDYSYDDDGYYNNDEYYQERYYNEIYE